VRRFVPIVLAALLLCLSSCRLVFGGRGTQNCVIDRTLERAEAKATPSLSVASAPTR
jgi:hypothetical protein